MKLKVKLMHISTGGIQVGMLNHKDAFQFDLNALDRLKVQRGSRQTTVVLDISEFEEMIPPGHIGIYHEVEDVLGVKDDDIVDVSLSVKPHSVQYIKKKLDGKTLNEAEINELLHDITRGRISEVELTYYVAANYTRGMKQKEIVALTKAMISTGEVIKVKEKPVIDKHCIGGVANNRTTPIIVPILLACGLKVPKTSSRSITSPAGTADAMEVLCNVTLGMKEVQKILKKHNGFIIWGGSVNLAPADDTIINVEHPLSIDAKGQLLASIMAKKGSVSATHVLVDIPIGKYAKVKKRKRAESLKRDFENIGKKIGIKTKVIITEGNTPIGNGIGPALEAKDFLYILRNDERAPEDLKKKSLKMASIMLEMAGHVKKGHGYKMAKEMLESGVAYKKFVEIVKAQGKNPDGKIITDPDEIKLGKYQHYVRSPKRGKVTQVRNNRIAHLARAAGCPVDKYAGIYLHAKPGDRVEKGSKLMTLYAQNKIKYDYARNELKKDSGIDIR